MLIGPRQESRFRQLEPIKNKRGQKEILRWDSRKVIPNELEEDKIYLKSLVLVRHLRIEA
jgi:translation initiation factor 2 beta subunit (eIF-2beta)/eIF-5